MKTGCLQNTSRRLNDFRRVVRISCSWKVWIILSWYLCKQESPQYDWLQVSITDFKWVLLTKSLNSRSQWPTLQGKQGNFVEGTTWTIYYKAIFGVGGLSRTRTITFAASSSPDSGSLATWSRALGPFTPSLPLTGCNWNDNQWKSLNLNLQIKKDIISSQLLFDRE